MDRTTRFSPALPYLPPDRYPAGIRWRFVGAVVAVLVQVGLAGLLQTGGWHAIQLDGAPVVSTLVRVLGPEDGQPVRIQAAAITPPPVPMVTAPSVRLAVPTIRLASAAAQGTLSMTPATPASGHSGRDDYIARIQAHLDNFRRRTDSGLVYVRFSIDRGGRVQSVAIERSSGAADLDQEALRLLRLASPLPPVPPALAGQTFSVTMPITFGPRSTS